MPELLSLEDQKLRAMMAGYPDPIQADCIWLGCYLRERCARNLGALAATIKKLGYDFHETTLARILRGKLFDDEGKPLVRLKTLSAMIEALRRDEQLALMSGRIPFVETTTWELIRNYIDWKRAPDTVCKFGLIIGPTGSQKSECAKQYQLRNNHGLVVHMESPETPTMCKFLTKLASKYGVSEFHPMEKKRLRISESVSDRSTIIIDNIQRMYKDRRGWDQPIFNYLQQLQDDTGCTIILICVPEFEITLSRGMDRGYFEQFEGRVGGRSEFLVLPDFAPREDILAIASAFGLQDAEKHARELENIARLRGRIRILFNALQKGKRLAGNRVMTINHVRQAMNLDDHNND